MANGADPRATAQKAIAANDWATAFDALTHLSEISTLSADDLDGLAQAAWWVGRIDVSMDAYRRAYPLFVDANRPDQAIMTAVYLSYDHANKGEFAIAAGWHARARRLAAVAPDSLGAGYLGIIECSAAYHAGKIDACLARAERVTKIGEDRHDPTLVAWGLHWQGIALIKLGQLERGWMLVDEAMLEVTLREMQPLWAGFLHCNTIRLCDEFADPKRGWQWIEVTERWLATGSEGPLYPGICRTFKASILRERGTWPEAEREARRACDELLTIHLITESRAYYELGEIRRLRGDFDAAERCFRKADEMGFDPQPGLARLRLAQGDIDTSSSMIGRAVSEAGDGLARARILPDAVVIAVAHGDREVARSAANDLTQIATTYRTPGLMASAASARADELLGRPDPSGALAAFRNAARLWGDLLSPYRAAVARVGVGEALRALGDEDGARLELESAQMTFERLGAVPDMQRTARLLGSEFRPGRLSDREVQVLRLVASGRANKEIAAELSISEHTVARHMANIFTKLDVSSRSAATAYALRHGIA